MSILDRVREKFQTPVSSTSGTSRSPSAGFAGAQDRHLKVREPLSAGSAGTREGHLNPSAPVVVADDPVEHAREARRREAVTMLSEVGTARFAAIAGETLNGFVPVMIAVRTDDYGTVTGELAVPADRWDAALFLKFMEEQDNGLCGRA